jgi:hypothetical protein
VNYFTFFRRCVKKPHRGHGTDWTTSGASISQLGDTPRTGSPNTKQAGSMPAHVKRLRSAPSKRSNKKWSSEGATVKLNDR